MAVVSKISIERQAPAVYMIGDEMLENRILPLAREVDIATADEIEVGYIDKDGPYGAELTDRYGIAPEQIPAILILETDDEIYHDWYGMDVPAAEQVLYELGQLTGVAND